MKPWKPVVAVGGGVVLVSVAALMIVMPPPSNGASSPGGSTATTGGAQAVLPDPYPSLYESAAAACPGLDWHVLEAVGQVESHHGANDGPSSAGALGPMQFEPSTWAIYGDGNPADVMVPAAAIPAAERMLCLNAGGRGDNQAALTASLSIYNAGSPDSPAGLAYASQVLGVAVALDVLNDPRITLSANARTDVTAGVDPALLSFLEAAAGQDPITVGTLITGHTIDVAGTNRVSEHSCGKAVDITDVAGAPVTVANAPARALLVWTAGLPSPLRPEEVGTPWPELDVLAGFFTETPDHLHVGMGLC